MTLQAYEVRLRIPVDDNHGLYTDWNWAKHPLHARNNAIRQAVADHEFDNTDSDRQSKAMTLNDWREWNYLEEVLPDKLATRAKDMLDFISKGPPDADPL